MKCAIPTITGEDLQIATSPTIGVNKLVAFSYAPILRVGEILQPDADAGGYTAEVTYQPPSDATVGRDLQMMCLNSVRSEEEQIVVTLAATLAGTTAWSAAKAVKLNDLFVPVVANGHVYQCTTAGITGSTAPTWPLASGGTVTDGTAVWTELSPVAVATFQAPSTARDQSANLPQGTGVDIVTPPGTTIRTITGVISVTGGAMGNQFGIISIPEADTFTTLAEVKSFDLDPPTGKPVPLAQRYDPAHWVVKGRPDVPKLTIGSPVVSFGDGLARLNGQRMTIRNEVWKEDRLLTQRVFVGGFRAAAKMTSPDGDGEEELKAEGIFEQFAFFN